jgi:Uma2 family endonuclease
MLQLGARLRGGPCRLFTADVAVKIPNGQVRRPDVGVHCSAFNENAPSAAEPVLVVEVLSRSTESTDRYRKLEEYKTVPGLRHILLVDPATPQAVLWSREADGAWGHAVLTGLDAVAELPGIGAALRLADIYEELTFRPAPRLVMEPPMLPQA